MSEEFPGRLELYVIGQVYFVDLNAVIDERHSYAKEYSVDFGVWLVDESHEYVEILWCEQARCKVAL